MSPYLLRDFFIDYNWEAIRPLIPRDNVIIIRGSRHGYAHSVFPISQPHSVYNLWGFFNLEEQRLEFIYALSVCLPVCLCVATNISLLKLECYGKHHVGPLGT